MTPLEDLFVGSLFVHLVRETPGAESADPCVVVQGHVLHIAAATLKILLGHLGSKNFQELIQAKGAFLFLRLALIVECGTGSK